jgi:hypothetical protein
MASTISTCNICKENLSDQISDRVNKQTKTCCGRMHNKCLYNYFSLFRIAKCPTCNKLIRDSMLKDLFQRTPKHPEITTFPVEWQRTISGLHGITEVPKEGFLYIGPYLQFRCDYGHGVYKYQKNPNICFVVASFDDHEDCIMALWLVGGDVLTGTTYPIAIGEYGWRCSNGTLVKL